MAIQPTFTACCFESLTRFVAEANRGWKQRWSMEMPGLCFRGADSQAYDLNPSLLRDPYPHASSDQLANVEAQLWVEFMLRSKPLLGYQVGTPSAAMLIMQQHGFPTRFLDWSRSLAVATYFAVRNLKEEADGAVWIMAARHLMEIRGAPGWRSVVGAPDVEAMGLRVDGNGRMAVDRLDEFEEQTPIAVSPHQLDPRMIAQRGIYTLHTFQKDALERLREVDQDKHNSACFLYKIIIPADAKYGFRSDLSLIAGVTEESLFPDIGGFARGFKIEWERKAKGEIGSGSQ